MSLSHLARYAISLSPRAAAGKAAGYARRIVTSRLRELLMKNRETFASTAVESEPLVSFFGSVDADLAASNGGNLKVLCDRVLAHQFDLLGSGWTELSGSFDEPLLSAGNRERSAAIRSLIDPMYKPIDWQVDFKSGYRWRSDRLSGSLAYGHEPGVDVKVPWELARCQHLPWLARCYIAAPADTWADEFRNQVLDFAAANPPGYGVNWMCTMDVAIRAANLVLAYDLFRAGGVHFSAAFESEFHALIVGHGRHIFANLEWSQDVRGNHYLANLAGLMFVAAALPSGTESEGWLDFASMEFVVEVDRQFNSDGSNFEASTSYHLLSAEMAAYGTALLLGLSGRGRQNTTFPSGYFEKLERMAAFSADITKPNGRVVQIGDNDSGRFFKLTPAANLEHQSSGIQHQRSV